jgi:hypothetical protein
LDVHHSIVSAEPYSGPDAKKASDLIEFGSNTFTTSPISNYSENANNKCILSDADSSKDLGFMPGSRGRELNPHRAALQAAA